MFRVSSHPSSGEHKTVTTASGTGHTVQLQQAVVTVLCTPDDGCDETRNM